LPELVLFVGVLVPAALMILAHFVKNQQPTDAAPVMRFGIKKNARERIHRDVNKTPLCFIPDVEPVFALPDQIFAVQNVRGGMRIPVRDVPSLHMHVVPDKPLLVPAEPSKMDFYVTRDVAEVIKVSDPFAGRAAQANIQWNAVPDARPPQKNV
jgi:hypothetical protein